MANLNVNVTDGNNLTVQVTPVPRQVIQINRGTGGGGNNNLIAGYHVVMRNIQYRDVVMLGSK